MNKAIQIETNGKPTLSFDLHMFITQVLTLKSIQLGYFEFSFVSKAFIHKLNLEHLNHDYETDIISFNLAASNDPIQGDVYICIAVAKENAIHFNTSFEDEIRLLVTHGILHLLGYEDYTDKDKRIMENEQNRLLTLIKTDLL